MYRTNRHQTDLSIFLLVEDPIQFIHISIQLVEVEVKPVVEVVVAEVVNAVVVVNADVVVNVDVVVNAVIQV